MENEELYFVDQPKNNHEFFFAYDNKKQKCISGENGEYPVVKLKDNKRRSGSLKVVLVDPEPIKYLSINKYRLHRHKLEDFSSIYSICNNFGVATYILKNYDYDKNNEISIELKNLCIRRSKNTIDELKNKLAACKNSFDPFNIGFGNSNIKFNLNSARLCCQVIFDNNTKSEIIVSNKIENCKSDIKIHEWDHNQNTSIHGGDKFFIFTSELKPDQRNIYAVFSDVNENIYAIVKPDYIHCFRSIRLTVPPFRNLSHIPVTYPLRCKFHLSVDNRIYKSEHLFFYYTSEHCCKRPIFESIVQNNIKAKRIKNTKNDNLNFELFIKRNTTSLNSFSEFEFSDISLSSIDNFILSSPETELQIQQKLETDEEYFFS